MQPWDARRYDRFEAERARPSRDLIARIPPARAPRRILDLGCGSALSTVELARAFPEAEIVGVDVSADMLAAAAKRLPGAVFLHGDAASFDTAGFDLVFANALFHWVPNHLEAIRRIARALPEGGALAFQAPDNEDEPSHRLMRAVAARPGFEAAAEAAAAARERIGGFADYEAALVPPCDEVDLWRTTYAHRLGSADDVVKWVEGSGLRPFLDALDADKRAAFLAAYRDEVANAYAPRGAGAVIFPFPRLFAVASRGLTRR
jgi:trans-aconitate 2-methyltransferase